MTIRLPAIPTVSAVKDPTVATILRPMKESIELLGAAVTGESLANPNNTVPSSWGNSSGSSPLDPTVVFVYDYTPPPAPTNLSVGGAFQNIVLAWDELPLSYTNHAYTEIWRSSIDAIGAASLLGFSPGVVYVDSAGVGQTYYYWVRFVSTSDVTGPFNAVSGVLGTTSLIGSDVIQDAAIINAKIADLAVDDAKIASLTAGKIASGEIAADRIITVGGSGLNAPLVLSGTGEIISNNPNGNKARFYSGNVEIYKNVPVVGQVLYKALSRIETGTANSGVVTTIPGYFLAQPKIIVSPNSIRLYDTSFSNQNQTLNCQATNITETSAGSLSWQFTPTATLTLGANTGSAITNFNSGVISANTHTSTATTTPSNCTVVTAVVSVSSNRGNGSSQYFRRQARCRVEYFNGAWVTTAAFVTVTLPDDTTSSVIVNPTVTLPSAAAWQIRVYTEFLDFSPSTLFGAVQYNFTQHDVTAPNKTRSDANMTQQATNAFGDVWFANFDSPTYPTPGGTGEIYQIDYRFTTGEAYTYNGSSTANQHVYSISLASNLIAGTRKRVQDSGQADRGSHYDEPGNSSFGTRLAFADTTNQGTLVNQTVVTVNLSRNLTVSGSNLTFKSNYWSLGTQVKVFQGNTPRYAFAWSNVTATVYRRTVQTNSTTPNNVTNWQSYNFTLTAAQVLATGSLNYLAIGY